MSKFVLNSNTVLTVGGNSLSCYVSADLSDTIDTFLSQCAGQTYKATITGLQEASMTFNGEIETDDVTAINNFAPGTTGALVFQPNGTTSGDISISSTNVTVVDRSMAFSSSSLSTISVTINLDDLTVAANV